MLTHHLSSTLSRAKRLIDAGRSCVSAAYGKSFDDADRCFAEWDSRLHGTPLFDVIDEARSAIRAASLYVDSAHLAEADGQIAAVMNLKIALRLELDTLNLALNHAEDLAWIDTAREARPDAQAD